MKHIRVAFDHRIFITQQFGGISRYIVETARELPAFGVRPRIVAPLHVNAHLVDAPRAMHRGRRLRWATTPRRIAKVVDAVAAGPLTALADPDIVHESFYGEHRFAPKRARIVTMVHDMIPEIFTEQFRDSPMIAAKLASVRRADHIFCNSESTRRDLLSRHPELEDKTSVTLLGFAVADRAEGDMGGEAAAERPYLLYVGNREGYKNFAGLVEGLGRSARLRSAFDLRCFGGGPLSAAEQAAVHAAGLEGRVHQEQGDDALLAHRYRHAAAFVYPSLYEGFGIPPLEAMAEDCPVVTIAVSSMPEVCADAAEYAAPGDTDALVAAIERVVFDSARADALRAAGRARLSAFSWQRCAAATAEGYRRIL